MSPIVLFIAIGTVLMGVPMLFMMHHDRIPAWKGIVSTIFLTIAGAGGAALMFWVEKGYFEGFSFFGALFMVPLVFVFVSYMLRISYGHLTDICTVSGCVMTALMKVNCYRSGCCGGRTIGDVCFPSQWVELVTALLIGAVLMTWFYRSTHRRGTLYGWYFLLYGSTRFVLNFMRAEWESPDRIPMGNVWSVVAVIVGAFWLMIMKNKELDEQLAQLQQKQVSETSTKEK